MRSVVRWLSVSLRVPLWRQIYEIKLDALMKRTMNRPLPSGRISRPHALVFAIFTGLGGTALLAAKVRLLIRHPSNSHVKHTQNRVGCMYLSHSLCLARAYTHINSQMHTHN
jgi:hypothetical protein